MSTTSASRDGFLNLTVQTTVHLLPSRLNSLKDGIQALFSSMLMRYQAQFDGVVIAYDKLKILSDQAAIFNERPHVHFDVQARLLVYRPQLNGYVTGVVNEIAPDHVGVLVHGIFNATIHANTGGLTPEYEYDPHANVWVNHTLSKTIEVGTKLRLLLTKIKDNRQIMSFECSLQDPDDGDSEDTM